MPLIPNYIARLRTHSQSTAVTSSSHSGSATVDPGTPDGESSRLGVDTPAVNQIRSASDPVPQHRIARKIHPDLNALLNENAAADNAAETLGPLPPRRLSRSASHLVGKASQGDFSKEVIDEDEQHAGTEALAADDPRVSPSPRSPFLSRILSTPILSGVRSSVGTATDADPEFQQERSGNHWSTFGRHRVRTPPSDEVVSLHRRSSGSKSSVHSKASKSRFQRTSAPVTPSATRSPSRVQTAASTHDTPSSQPPSSQPDSPAGTVSSSSGSKSYSMHSQSVRSRRLPQAYPETIPDVESFPDKNPQTPAHVSSQNTSLSPVTSIPATLSSRATKPHLDGSPQTFGRGTPTRPSVAPKAPPEFDDASQPPFTSTPPPARFQYTPRGPLWTYPTRSHKRSFSGTSAISFPSLPIKPFARSRSKSRPRAEDLFQDGIQGLKSGTLGRLRLGSLLGEGMDDGERRVSAEWSAAEAVRNGTSGARETWPATVSREVVMLSLGDGGHDAPIISTASHNNVSEVGEAGILREGGTKNPTLFGSIGDERLHFLRAARRWIMPRSALPVDSSSSAPQQSTLQPPVVTVFPTIDPTVSTLKPPAQSNQESREPRDGGLVLYPSVTAPTPSTSVKAPQMQITPDSGPSESAGSPNDESSKSHGKRKKDVESEDEAHPNEHGPQSILLRRRQNSTRLSDASYAPSSFRQAKRIRLSTPSHSPPHDGQPSAQHSPSGSPGSRQPPSLRSLAANSVNLRTLSQSSIPMRAIVSPKPPSIDRRSTYHMRDPELPPPRRMSAQWTGGARKDEIGRIFPLQGWAFMVGFLLFPMWWVAAAAPVEWGWVKRAVGTRNGKGVWSEEDLAAREVVEYDIAYTWRQRCRLMSLLGLFVYIPLIVLLAVLVPRSA